MARASIEGSPGLMRAAVARPQSTANPGHPQRESKMPKLKTKSGVKKRFKLTATGKVKHGVAGKRHRLISHNAKYIRQNRGTEVLAVADTARVKLWAPYGLN
jgi:large subunit ribosomal protein L35